jgi:hypothetical protein
LESPLGVSVRRGQSGRILALGEAVVALNPHIHVGQGHVVIKNRVICNRPLFLVYLSIVY